jgi:hypothetical protein
VLLPFLLLLLLLLWSVLLRRLCPRQLLLQQRQVLLGSLAAPVEVPSVTPWAPGWEWEEEVWQWEECV